jgi:hypothetical protein
VFYSVRFVVPAAKGCEVMKVLEEWSQKNFMSLGIKCKGTKTALQVMTSNRSPCANGASKCEKGSRGNYATLLKTLQLKDDLGFSINAFLVQAVPQLLLAGLHLQNQKGNWEVWLSLLSGFQALSASGQSLNSGKPSRRLSHRSRASRR